MIVACLQLDPSDPDRAWPMIAKAVTQAAQDGASVIVLPELVLSGFDTGDPSRSRQVAQSRDEGKIDALAALLGETAVVIVAGFGELARAALRCRVGAEAARSPTRLAWNRTRCAGCRSWCRWLRRPNRSRTPAARLPPLGEPACKEARRRQRHRRLSLPMRCWCWCVCSSSPTMAVGLGHLRCHGGAASVSRITREVSKVRRS